MSESYTHKAAIEVGVRILRDAAQEAGFRQDAEALGVRWEVNRFGPHWGVWPEYPIEYHGLSHAWDERDAEISPWWAAPPTYRDMIEKGFGTGEFGIADIAVQDSGYVNWVIEIVHTSLPRIRKLKAYRSLGLRAYFIDAGWLMGHCEPPRQMWPFLEINTKQTGRATLDPVRRPHYVDSERWEKWCRRAALLDMGAPEKKGGDERELEIL